MKKEEKVLSLKQHAELNLESMAWWDALEPLIKLKKHVYGMYGIGSSISTIDGDGTILTLHGRAVEVSLKSVHIEQELHGFEGNGRLHRSYLFKDFYCPLIVKPLSLITDEEAIALCKIDNRLGIDELSMTNEKRIAWGRNNIYFIIYQVEAYMHLQQCGYALPIFHKGIKYSDSDLIELGIYKII